MNKDSYDRIEKKINQIRQNIITWGAGFLAGHPRLKLPIKGCVIAGCFFCRLFLQLAKQYYLLADLVMRRKKAALFFGLSAICLIAALIAGIKLVQHSRIKEATQAYGRDMREIYVFADTVKNVSQAYTKNKVSGEYTNPKVSDENTKPAEIGENAKNDVSQAEVPARWYDAVDVDIKGLKEQNPDIAGWIHFEDDSGISYPLLYSGDDHYLRRNYLGDKDIGGSIYIEGNNSPDLSNAHTLIYGHNMRNLTMFGKLKYYKTEDGYLENHRYFQLITEDRAYRYEIFAYRDVSGITGGIFTTWKYVDEDFKAFVADTICGESYVDADIDVNEDTHIVTLSTCTDDPEERFVVSALRVDEYQYPTDN